MYHLHMTQNDLKEQLKDAMRAKDATKLAVIRGIMTAATNELVSSGRTPTDALTKDEMAILIRRAAKQRKDSIEQFEAGGRPELAEQEKVELAILEGYLPALMAKEEVEKLATAKAAEMNITDKTGANQLMGALMKDLKGKADGTVVKAVVDSMFV